jgi:RNA polymerase sigma-70 factor (ECF subfamily)
MKAANIYNQLAARLKKGDRKAGEELFDQFAPVMFRYFFARTSQRETAQDLTQECFARLLQHIGQFDPEQGNFHSWFWRIARNLLIDTYRQKKPSHSLESMQDAGIDIVDPTERILPHVELQRILELVKTLSPEEQELFNQYFIADTSYAELAEMTGKSEANLRVTIHRMKKKIIELANS